MQRIRIGHVGCGSVSLRGILPHLSQEDAQEHVKLVAVCDVDGSRAKAVSEQFGFERSYDNYEEMLAADDIDMVILATPIALHAAQAEKALRAGKHVFVNKAMALTLEESDRVLKARQETGLQVVSAPGQLLSPAISHIREMVQRGDFGEMYWGITSNVWFGHGVEKYEAGGQTIKRDPSWYFKKPGGGPIYDMAVYSLHSLTGILGPVRRVTAMSGIVRPKRQFEDIHIDVTMDDNTWMIMDFGNGCFVTAGAGLCHYGQHMFWGQMALYGSNGGIEVLKNDSKSGWPGQIRVLRDSQESMIAHDISEHPLIRGPHLDIEEPHVYVDIMHLVDCIRTGKQPVASLEHARHVVEVIEKAYLAAQTGQAQDLTTTF